MSPLPTLAALLLFASVLGCNSGHPTAEAHPLASAVEPRSAPPSPPVTDAVPTTIYRDPDTGVAFRYPVVWSVGAPPGNNLPSALTGDPNVTIRHIVFFSPEGNLYARTNLSQLNFLFAIGGATSPEACRDLVAKNGELNAPAITIHTAQGLSFTQGQGSDGAAGHTTSFTLDSIFHRGRCLVFDRDFAVIAPGLQQGATPLTPSQNTALQKHLDAVFASVTLP